MTQSTSTTPHSSSPPSLHTYMCKTSKMSQKFVIPTYYKIQGILGTGAYGMVVLALDTRTDTQVAIKKNHSIFSAHPNDREYHKRILREIMILRHFEGKEGNDNLICLLDLGVPVGGVDNFDEVYLIMELMGGDLRRQIQSNEEFQDDDVKYFLYSILLGLTFMHSAGVLHRDLKPSNILLDQDMHLKICDFGLSRGVELSFDTAMSTVQVVTRWYRAPELLLMWDKNTHLAAFDIWSVGCIFAELLQKPRRRPIFPGKHYLDQIDQIIKICGTPSQDDIRGVGKAINYVNKLPPMPKRPFFKGQEDYPNPLAIDLLEKMLAFNPEKRITLDDALAHPYLKEIRDEEFELTCDPFKFRFTDEMKTEDIKRMIYDECVNWHKERGAWNGETVNIDTNIVEVITE
mmetsp:Transcript_5272/g.19716  ORF Transcript_5272/g.19716 Transcript_5272/m.19716 type:complete len:403 (-) Transcript_5272:234-1442(-)|eukprot:CAMPEP_0117442740 /NCGR_PEP_ID=MMETSP0759-20121206/4315_1 /TAXON_ID=63605 /ORGANISM="Percolomonas cosmopolitus, Strain WS" /LENGTH=402 /DNA_ID=CAMNT_0005234653 /DNA_START=182 /DNA_END=1390 /DNA_ORIENTATION=+